MIDFMERLAFAYEEENRQTGRTTRLALKALEEDAIFVCSNPLQAKQLQSMCQGDRHLKTMSLDTYLRKETHRGKIKKEKYIFDHFTEYELIRRQLSDAKKIMEDVDYITYK